MNSVYSLRLVVIAPDMVVSDAGDEAAAALVERSRQLRIGLLEGGFNLIATLPADTFKALVKHPLTDKGLDQFLADWGKTGQSIL